jgi:hypothetical protein
MLAARVVGKAKGWSVDEQRTQELACGFNWTQGLITFLGTSAFAASGYFLAYHMYFTMDAGPVPGLLLVIGLFYALLLTLIAMPYARFIWVALGKPTVLRIGEEGLYYAFARDKTIPWDKVLAVSKSKNNLTSAFNVSVDPALPVAASLLTRLMGAAEQNMTAIASNVVKASDDEVYFALVRYLPEEKRKNMRYWAA